MSFAYGTITLCGAAFQTASAKHRFCNSFVESDVSTHLLPLPPYRQRRQAIAPDGFGLDPFSLAATGGVAVAFLSSGY